jgi:hypothetical protein
VLAPAPAPARPAGPGDGGAGGVLPRTEVQPQLVIPLDEAEVEGLAPQLFGAPTSHVPASPTPSQILDSVQASAAALDEAAPAAAGSEYGSYGHIVDLSVGLDQEAEAAPPGGFIKDPLRRTEAQPARAGAPVRTQHVTVVVSRAEMKQGGTIRLVVDLKLEA